MGEELQQRNRLGTVSRKATGVGEVGHNLLVRNLILNSDVAPNYKQMLREPNFYSKNHLIVPQLKTEFISHNWIYNYRIADVFSSGRYI